MQIPFNQKCSIILKQTNKKNVDFALLGNNPSSLNLADSCKTFNAASTKVSLNKQTNKQTKMQHYSKYIGKREEQFFIGLGIENAQWW